MTPSSGVVEAGVTARLAAFVAGARLADLPGAVVETARDAFMDTIGVILAGSEERSARIARTLVARAAPRSARARLATVLGTSACAPAHEAAFANGVAAHALDYDDFSISMWGHPSASLVPALMALGETEGASGARVLEAYVVGFEIAAKMGAAVFPDLRRQGWHDTGPLGAVACAVAAAKLLGLDPRQTRMALGIAASAASGLFRNVGTMTKHFHAGNAARSGVLAAELARDGFTAAEDILEAPAGFFGTFVTRAPGDPAARLAALGAPWDLETPGVTIKPYPCCGCLHSILDGVLDLARRHDVQPERVRRVRCGISPFAVPILCYPRPADGDQAKFSIPFAVAVALARRRAGLREFSTDTLGDPVVRTLMPRVEGYAHPDLTDSAQDSVAAHVRLQLEDGTVVEQWVRHPRGSPERPLTRQEVADKYAQCAAPVLSAEAIASSLQLLFGLEEVKTVTDLSEVLVPG